MVVFLAILGTFRLSRALSMEDGPFDAFIRFRTAVSNRLGHEHWIAKGLSCPRCLSFWVPVFFLIFMTPSWIDIPFYWFGISGGAYLLIIISFYFEVKTLKA